MKVSIQVYENHQKAMNMIDATIQKEFEEINQNNGWQSVFQEIKDRCDKEAKENLYSVCVSTKGENRLLNRYRDVNPYDHSRIVISRGKTDYINANLVKLERADRKYILTQGPLKETVGHFWLMIWEQNSKAIIMLNKLLEKKQVKCHMYWPDQIGSNHSLQLMDVGLNVEFLNCEEYTNYSKRTFRLTDLDSNSSREIIQFHYTTWPDFGIPSSPNAFLQFLKQIRESGALSPDVGPAVIHCSAGIGRSGTFCLVDCCLVLIEKGEENHISVQDVLHELRKFRMGLIQTSDQLYFSYRAIIEGMKLLKNNNLLSFEEDSLEEGDYDDPLDDAPPPLPPRVQSLQITNILKKPLPVIPNSESVFENLIPITDSNAEYEASSVEPFLLQDPHQLIKTASAEDLVEEHGNVTGMRNTEESNGNNNETVMSVNAVVENELINADLDRSNASLLRQRRRAEKKIALENKIQDIKTKQREIIEQVKMSKERKTLFKYILAAVIVGSVCMYAYSRLS